MAPMVERPTPPYLQIAERIRKDIKDGRLKDGDLVPSVRELARDSGVSRPTAAKAITHLRTEGLVETEVGVGTKVCAGKTTHQSGRDRLQALRSTGRIYPPNEHAIIKSAELVPAPDDIADALGVEPGTPVIRRHRVTYRDDTPISASTTWLDGSLAKVAPKLLSTERILNGTVGHIEEVTGRSVVDWMDQDSAREATDRDAEELGVAAGSAVAIGRNWWWDAEGATIEYGERVSVPGRWSTHRKMS